MYKSFQRSTNNISFKYSFVASFSIIVFLFTFVTSTAYGATTTTVTNIGNNEFTEPTGLAVDRSGDNIYVAEDSGIKKIDISSNTTTATAVSFTDSSRVALDSSDNIYVLDSSNDNIYKTNRDGSTTTLAMSNYGVSSPYEIALNSSNNIYVVQYGKVWIFNANGQLIGSFNQRNNVYSLNRVAVDSIGNIYVEYFDVNSRYAIDKLDSNGNFIATIISGDNSSNMHVAVDSSNNVYISKHDTDNNKNIIYKMNTSGQMEVYASYDSENGINGIAVDNNGNIYAIEGNYVKKITVSPELKIDTNNPPNATVGTPYSYTFESTGGIGEKTYTVTDPSSLPAGLTLSENGTLSGIPTAVGTSQFTITATDSEASTSSRTVNLTVCVPIPISPELKINTANPLNATVGTAYSYIFTSTGGIGTKTYAVTEGSLPAGLTLSTDGTLSGIPTTIGGGTFTITVTDSATPIASTSSATVNLTVLVANSSGGSSSGSSSDSTSTPGSDSTQFLATVTNYTAPPLPVVIITGTDGTQKGKLEIKENIAKEIVDSLNKQGGDTAIVTMSDPQGKLSSLTASIPTAAIATFANSGKNLGLETPNGGVILSNQNMKDYANISNQALYFTITPVKDAMAQTETDIRAVELQLQQLQQQILLQLLQHQRDMSALQQQQQQLQQQLDQLQELQKLQQQSSQSAGSANGITDETKGRISQLQGLLKNNSLRVGSTVDIESNMPKGISVGVGIPMGPVNSPAQEAEMKKDSASYVIIAEHSPEDVESLSINKITFNNKVAVAEASTTRFSKFTIIKLSQKTTSVGTWENDEQGWKYIENGQPVTGWNQIGGSWYLMNPAGIMEIGWKEVNGTWYLLKDDGAMATGWQQSNGQWYYLHSDGAMASNTVIDGYELDENGAWIK